MKWFVTLALLWAMIAPALAQFPGLGGGSNSVKVELVSELRTVVPGEAFFVGLKMEHDPGWHSYWTNPGIGMPTEVAWELPEGFEAGEKLSPMPEVKEDVIGNTHIYHDTIYHVYQIKVPADLEAETVTLKGTASWLQCIEDRCDPPQRAPVEITLAVGDTAEVNEDVRIDLDEVLAQQPEALDAWEIATSQTAETYTFTLTPGDGANRDPGKIYVFEEEQLLAATNPQVTKEGDKIIVTAAKEGEDEIAQVSGFLHAENGWVDGVEGKVALALSKPEAGDDGRSGKVVNLSGEEEKSLTIWLALVLAFIGGMILNLMPCVFPVLSIKILGFVEQASEDPGKVKQHGLAFGVGVIVSCLLLAAIIIGINAATGQAKGWGSHMGYPPVAAAVVIIMFVLGLNLAGLFEMGTSLVGAGSTLSQKKGLSGSFFSGVLTTVVATPCSGPFLGVVMSYTLSQPIHLALVLFTFFGAGVAAPYVLLSFFPKLVEKLPPPGAWMETFKQVMAFPMFGAAIFFFRNFVDKTGAAGATWFLTGLLFIAMALWIYGKWCTPMRSKATRTRGIIIALLVAALGLKVVHSSTQYRAKPKNTELATATQLAERIRDLRDEGRMVFVDFTASW